MLLLTASASAQTAASSDASRLRVELPVFTSEIPRNVALLATVGQVGNTGADIALDRLFGPADTRGMGSVLRRIGQLWFVNVPIASLTTMMTHNSGHFARAHEFGADVSMDVTDWPWPVPLSGSVEYLDGLHDATPALRLAAIGGGEQGSRAARNVLMERILSRDHADYFDHLLLAHSQLDAPLYAWTDLRPRRLRTFWEGTGRGGSLADFGQYAFEMASHGLRNRGFLRFEDIEREASRLRHAAWLNLADVALWTSAARVIQYVTTGERVAPLTTLRVGWLRLVPGAWASLGSDGPERGVDVWMVSERFLPRVQLRWIDTPSDRRLWALGGTLRAREGAPLLPEARADVWQREGKRAGFRLELGARGTFHRAGRPFETAVMVGYKTEGYLADAPRKAGVLASAGVVIPF